MKTRQSRAPRRGRFAALALTGAAASIMIIPGGLGVACASVMVPTVEAGGAPPKPVKHVTQTHYVTREKPILRGPRWQRPPRVDVIVDNYNDNFNRRHNRRHRQDFFRHDFKHEDIKKEYPVKSVEEVTPSYDEYDESDANRYGGNQYDANRPSSTQANSAQSTANDKWWWPGSKDWKNWN